MEKNIPKRRFKEFINSGEWEEKKLGDIYTFLKGKSLSLDSFHEGINNKAIAYGHLYTIYDEVIRKVNLSSNQEGIESKNGDILFPGSSTVPFGTAQANAIMVDGVNLGGDIIIAREENQQVYAPFISYQINSQKKKLYPIIVGTTITHMYGKDLINIKYSIPSLPEQEKISDFFEKLDRLIDLNRQKLEKLKNIKSAYLSEMFPKEGELYPKRRFAGFTEPWEEKKLGDVVEYIIDNRGKNPKYINPGEIPVIDNYMIKNKQYPDLKECNRFIDQETYQNFIRKYIVKDDILITLVGNGIGNITLSPNDKCVIVQNTLGLRVSVVKEFIFYTLMFNNKSIRLLDRGMAQPSIRQDELLNLTIDIPSSQEQEKIGNFFKKLDERIILQEEKIEKLENMKRAYLSEMFV